MQVQDVSVSAESEDSREADENPASAPTHLELALPAGLSRALDAWIANQVEPKPTRETAILQVLQEALGTRFGS